MAKITTTNYDVVNAQNTKEPIIILVVEGMPYVFSSALVYTTIRYDDEDVNYDGVYVYDGLRPLSSKRQKQLIDRKGSFSTISQKLEQWDGKASVETLNIKLVDYNKLITLMCSPGRQLDEILNKKVKIYFGFSLISYPEDYIKLFTGYVNKYSINQGTVSLSFTDPSSKRKQVLFNGSTSTLVGDIVSSSTTISMTSTSNLYQTILNAKGANDPGVTIGIVIDNEIITYSNANIINGTTLSGVTRGARGTIAAAHSDSTEIKCFIAFNDYVMNICLKILLSGWNGVYTSSVSLRGIINADDATTIPNSVTFSQGVNLERDYGVTTGDYLYLSGSGIPTNNGIFTISDIVNGGRTILVSETGVLSVENPPFAGFIPTTAAFRSQYDVYPKTAGLSLTPDDVFVTQFEYIRDVFAKIQFDIPAIGQESSGKTWMETYLLKPIGAYSLTQGSRISCGITHPPLTNDLSKFIGPSNVVNPGGISVERGLNERFFYNEILFNYDYDVVNDKYRRSLRVLNADAQSRLKQVAVLSVDVRGLNNSVQSERILKQRAARLLLRYKYGAETITLKTFFSVGHTIDAGDIVILTDSDPPVLQIANTETGTRGVVNRIMEVQERTIDITSGHTNLKLLSNNGFSLTDRYGVLSGSSQLASGFTHTSTLIKIRESWGGLFPGAEYKKWENYQGSTIRVHDTAYTQDAEATFTLDLSNPFVMHLSPALPFTPTSSMYIEFAKYNTTSAAINAKVKAQFVHTDPSASIFSASSSTVFTLNSGFSNRYTSGMIVYVQSPDCTRFSPDVKIVSVIGDVVTIGPIFTGGTNPNLGFTPSPGDFMQLGGFKDGGAAYRLI